MMQRLKRRILLDHPHVIIAYVFLIGLLLVANLDSVYKRVELLVFFALVCTGIICLERLVLLSILLLKLRTRRPYILVNSRRIHFTSLWGSTKNTPWSLIVQIRVMRDYYVGRDCVSVRTKKARFGHVAAPKKISQSLLRYARMHNIETVDTSMYEIPLALFKRLVLGAFVLGMLVGLCTRLW